MSCTNNTKWPSRWRPALTPRIQWSNQFATQQVCSSSWTTMTEHHPLMGHSGRGSCFPGFHSRRDTSLERSHTTCTCRRNPLRTTINANLTDAIDLHDGTNSSLTIGWETTWTACAQSRSIRTQTPVIAPSKTPKLLIFTQITQFFKNKCIMYSVTIVDYLPVFILFTFKFGVIATTSVVMCNTANIMICRNTNCTRRCICIMMENEKWCKIAINTNAMCGVWNWSQRDDRKFSVTKKKDPGQGVS